MGFGCVFTIPSMELLLLLKASMRVCTMPFLWVIKKKKSMLCIALEKGACLMNTFCISIVIIHS